MPSEREQSGVLVEEATGADIAGVCGLDAVILGSSRRREFLIEAIETGQCRVARIGDTLAGFAVLEQSFYGQGFISLIATHPGYRRRGAATALVQHIESVCPTEKLFTSTNRSNTDMQQVLKKLGFVESGYIENLDEGDPELVYFKHIGERL